MLKDVPSSVEDILALGQDDPEYAAWKEKQPAMPNDLFSDIATLRAASEPSMQKSFEALGNPGQSLHIPMRDGFQSTVRIYHPKAQPPTNKSPLVVLLFGGGFVSGDNRQLAAFAIALASIYGAVVALPDYRLAPEHPFPAAQNDVWDTLTHLTSNAESLKLDPSAGFILGGVSAGGNIAAALSQKWINEGITPKLTGMWLSIPLLFNSSEFVPEEYRKYYLAREQNKDALGVNERALQWINHYQKPNPESPLYSPFNSPSLDGHRNVAKEGARVYFQVAGGDPLRDDGMIYERVLKKAGVDTKLDVYPGVPHGHFAKLPFLQSSQRANQDTIRQFSWLLRQDAPSESTIYEFYAAPGGA